MEKENKKIVYEFLLLHNAFNGELAQFGDVNYANYHSNNADWYKSFSSKFSEILGYTGQTEEDFIQHMSSVTLLPEQKRSLMEIRRHPMFKKVTGEAALKQKDELETLLGTKITLDGMTFADENGPRVAPKTTKQLDEELNSYSDKLSSLLSAGVITEEQYNRYDQMLDYIYGYYDSCSKGEQLPFRKISDSEYSRLQEMADENGISLSEQISQVNEDMKYKHDEMQELQSNQGFRR